jgi:hypothetical protein
MRLLKEFLQHRDDQSSLIKLILGVNHEEYGEFYTRQKQAEAHVIACMQSMHALSDTLGHVIYFATGQNRDVNTCLDPKSISIYSIQAGLERDPTITEMRCLTKELTDHPDYQYLSDFVNHSKHRSVIGTSFTISLVETADKPYGLELKAFEHNGRVYGKRWVDSTLESEYGRQATLVISIGEALNQWVRGRCALTTACT